MVFDGFRGKKILVADIGGTNARLAVAEITAPDQKPQLSSFKAYPCAEFRDVTTLIKQYLTDLQCEAPTCACLAVAGPVSQGRAHLTNLGWHIDAGRLVEFFSFDQVKLVNDFGALARSLPVLGEEDLLHLKQGDVHKNMPYAAIGPGTGFGVAVFVPAAPCAAGGTVVSTEGGHIAFVPQGKQETAVWSALQESVGRVTVETMLSGVGLMRIYRELCHIQRRTPLNYEPRTITQLALEGEDAVCLESLEIFCGVVGSVAGDMALALGARGGIYLGGGILPKISGFLQKSSFLERFLDKAPMSHVLETIPVHLIIAPDAALHGAALMMPE